MTKCTGCKYRSSLWGMACCRLGYWWGSAFEKFCSEYTREEKK